MTFRYDSPLEDKWILSRLHTVIKNVTDDLEHYRYADAMRELYDFAWDEFCSFYIEISKSRLEDDLEDDRERRKVQSVLCGVLIKLIKLLHPVIPFVTEEIWQRLDDATDLFYMTDIEREIWTTNRSTGRNSITLSSFPDYKEKFINPEIEKQFAVFQEVLRAVRDVRASRNVPPKTEIAFSVRCDEATAELLRPMEPYFLSMARAKATAWGPATQSPPLASVVPLTGMDVFVDISDLIDIPAEIAKLEKEIAKLEGFIQSKESKLASDFVQKAPPAVVEKERQALAELRGQHQSATAALGQLESR
jgi:valyl-tRNA synthetase